MWVGLLLHALGDFVFPFLSLALVARGYAVQDVGLVLSLLGAGELVSAPVGGFLADAIGRRTTLVVSLVSWAACALVVAFTSSHLLLTVAVVALGLCELFHPAAQAVIADVVPPARRSQAFALTSWALSLGFAVSLVVGGLLAQRSYSLMFVADAGATLAFAGVVLARVPETRPHGPRVNTTRQRMALGVLARDTPFLVFLVLNFCFEVLLLQSDAALPLDMSRRGLTPAWYGLVMALNGVVIIVVQPLLARRRGFWLDRSRMLALGSALAGVGFGCYGFARTPSQYAFATLIWTLGEIVHQPAAAALCADLAPVPLRGRYSGAFAASLAAAAIVAPVVGTTALARIGSVGLWGGCIGLGLVACGAHLASRRSRQARCESESEPGERGNGEVHAA